MLTSVMAEEKKAQFDSDAAAFGGLRPQQQRTAAFIARHTFNVRQGIVAANDFVMRGADWLYARALERPYNAIKPHFLKAKENVAGFFRRTFPAKPDSKFRASWRKATQKIGGKVTQAKDFLEFYGSLGLYRATKWAFNPRTKSGKPFFGNETVNKVVGTTLGVCSFVVLAGWVGWLEVMSKVWHAKAAQHALMSTAPWAAKLTRQLIVHPVISIGAAAGQFIVIPSIAAARQALKSTKLTQGVAYEYNRRLSEHREKHPPGPPAASWRPSHYVERFTAEIIEKSSPEFYRARIRHFEERVKQKLKEQLHRVPPQAGPASGLGQQKLGGAFNAGKQALVKTPAPPPAPLPPQPGH